MAFTISDITILLAFWASYFLLHSVLASLRFKIAITNQFPSLSPYYRMIFNLISVVLLIVPLWYLLQHPGEMLWEWKNGWKFVSYLLAFVSIGGFLWSFRYYDFNEFSGIQQARLQQQDIQDQENFQLSPMHRFVRHPWYSLGLIFIWSRDMNEAFFWSSVAITIYLFIGSHFEEKKLIRYHGETYREYRKHVPGIIPVPWKYLDKEKKNRLLQNYKTGKSH